MKSCSAIALLLAILPCRLLLAERIHPLDLLDVPGTTIATRWSPLAERPGGLDSLVLTNGSCFLVSRLSSATVEAWLAGDGSSAPLSELESDADSAAQAPPDPLVAIVAIESGDHVRDTMSPFELCAILSPDSPYKPDYFLAAPLSNGRYAGSPCLFGALLDDVNGQVVALASVSFGRKSPPSENAGSGP